MAGKRTAPHRQQPHQPPNPNPSRRAAPSAGAGASGSAGSGSSPPSKRMLAFHFLRALARIHSTTPGPRTIRRAAYSSMARAASQRRAWTQALLRQARARRSRQRAVLLRRRRVVVSAAAPPQLPLVVGVPAAGEASASASASAAPRHHLQARGGGPPPPRQAGEPARADALRRLVPGGAEMEYCSLLDETADYVRCLRAQVQLMQGLVDHFSDDAQ